MSLGDDAFERLARSPIAQAVTHSLKYNTPLDYAVLSTEPKILHSQKKVTIIQHERDNKGFLTPKSRPVRASSPSVGQYQRQQVVTSPLTHHHKSEPCQERSFSFPSSRVVQPHNSLARSATVPNSSSALSTVSSKEPLLRTSRDVSIHSVGKSIERLQSRQLEAKLTVDLFKPPAESARLVESYSSHVPVASDSHSLLGLKSPNISRQSSFVNDEDLKEEFTNVDAHSRSNSTVSGDRRNTTPFSSRTGKTSSLLNLFNSIKSGGPVLTDTKLKTFNGTLTHVGSDQDEFSESKKTSKIVESVSKTSKKVDENDSDYVEKCKSGSDDDFELITPASKTVAITLDKVKRRTTNAVLIPRSEMKMGVNETSNCDASKDCKTPVTVKSNLDAKYNVDSNAKGKFFSPGGVQSVSVVELEDWNLVPLWSSKAVALAGHKLGTPADELWRSTAIKERLNQLVVTTASGTMYILKGQFNRTCSLEEGLSKEVVKQFEQGFPPNWERRLQRFFHDHFERMKLKSQTEKQRAVTKKHIPRTRKSRKSSQSSMSEPEAVGRKSKQLTRLKENSISADSGVHMDAPSDIFVTPAPLRKTHSSKTLGVTNYHDAFSVSDSEESSSESVDWATKNKISYKSRSKDQTKLVNQSADAVRTPRPSHRVGKRELNGLLEDATPKTVQRGSKSLSESGTYIKSLPKTGSGRSVKPSLAWWSNERVVFNSSTDHVDIVKGTVDTIQETSRILALKGVKRSKKAPSKKPLKTVIVQDSSDSEFETFDKKSPVSYAKKGKPRQPSDMEYAKILPESKSGKLRRRKLSEKFNDTSKEAKSIKAKEKSKSSRGDSQGNYASQKRLRKRTTSGRSIDKTGTTTTASSEEEDVRSSDSKSFRLKKFNNQEIVKQKGVRRSKSTESSKEGNTLGLTGAVGTMKRKRHLRQMLELHNHGCEDDIGDSTPFRKRKKVQLPGFESDDSDGEGGVPSTTRRQNARTPANQRPEFEAMSTKKTPASTFLSPGILHSVNRNAVDLYINRLKKAPRVRTIMSRSKPSSTSTKYLEDISTSQLFDIATVSDHDSEEDYYWSDT